MKKLINNPNDVVKEMIGGLLTAHPSYLRKLDNIDVIVRKDAPVEGKVGLVSGGGSGHEPAHAGYVGYGMLDAACLVLSLLHLHLTKFMKRLRQWMEGKEYY